MAAGLSDVPASAQASVSFLDCPLLKFYANIPNLILDWDTNIPMGVLLSWRVFFAFLIGVCVEGNNPYLRRQFSNNFLPHLLRSSNITVQLSYYGSEKMKCKWYLDHVSRDTCTYHIAVTYEFLPADILLIKKMSEMYPPLAGVVATEPRYQVLKLDELFLHEKTHLHERNPPEIVRIPFEERYYSFHKDRK